MWICAIGKNLNEKMDEIIDEIIEGRGRKVTYIKLNKDVFLEIYNRSIVKAATQQNLAHILGVQRQNLYKWKERRRWMPLEVLKNIIDFTGIEIKVSDVVVQSKEFSYEMNREVIAKVVAERLNTNLNFTEKIIYGKRHEVAIIFLIELLGVWKELLNKSEQDMENKRSEIQSTFEFLKQNTNKAYRVKAVHELSPQLSEIVGGMLADGTVSSNLNVLSIIEADKKTIEEFSGNVNRLFGINSKVRRSCYENAWRIKIDSKIIHRYFTALFKFDEGKKRRNYDIPEIIKHSGIENRKACVKGVMSFDGSVCTKKQIGLNIGSKMLRDSVFFTLKRDGFILKKQSTQDKTGMWRLYSPGFLRTGQYQKWLYYFVEGSDKWYRIYEWMNGYKAKVNDIESSKIIIKDCFPLKQNSKITMSCILDMFLCNRRLSKEGILSALGNQSVTIHESTLWIYLGYLKDMNILAKMRLDENKNVYIINEKTAEWRLPYRPRFEEYYAKP